MNKNEKEIGIDRLILYKKHTKKQILMLFQVFGGKIYFVQTLSFNMSKILFL